MLHSKLCIITFKTAICSHEQCALHPNMLSVLRGNGVNRRIFPIQERANFTLNSLIVYYTCCKTYLLKRMCWKWKTHESACNVEKTYTKDLSALSERWWLRAGCMSDSRCWRNFRILCCKCGDGLQRDHYTNAVFVFEWIWLFSPWGSL